MSITKTASKFNIDKGTLKKYKDLDTTNLVLYKDNYYIFSIKEIEAVSEYISTSATASYIYKKYGFKQETLNKKLEVLGYPKDRKYKVDFDRTTFKSISTESDAYFLGLLLADGYVNNSRGMVRLKLQSCDIDILEKFCDYLKMSRSSIKGEIHRDTGNLQKYVGIHSKEIIERLESYGIFQGKSCKETPFYGIDRSLLPHYIRGYFDGDGSIRTDLSSINICGSKEILNFICQTFKEDLGIVKEEESFAYYCNMYKVTFCGKNMMNILNYLYQDSSIYLNRKYNLFTNMKEKRLAMFKSGNIGKS